MATLLEDQHGVSGLAQRPRCRAPARAGTDDDHRLLGHRVVLNAGRNFSAACAASVSSTGVVESASGLLTCSGVNPRGWVSPGQLFTVQPTRLRLPPYSGGPYVVSNTSDSAVPTKSCTSL